MEGQDESDNSLENELLSSQKTKEFLRKALIYSIQHKSEFSYLEQLASLNKCKFNEYLINFCLDEYIQLRKEKRDQFTSKYGAMWKTAYFIFETSYNNKKLEKMNDD